MLVSAMPTALSVIRSTSATTNPASVSTASISSLRLADDEGRRRSRPRGPHRVDGRCRLCAECCATATVQNVANIGMNLITGLCCLLIVIFNLFFDLTPEKHEKIRLELERRRAE